MFKSGYYVIGNRKILNDISERNCIMCHRLRQEVALGVAGPSHQLQAFKNTPAFSVINIDILGHFRLRVRKRGKSEKIWWLIAGCQYTRYCRIIPFLNLTASAVLMALEQIWYELGGNVSYIIYSDFGSQIVPLITTIDDNNEQAEEAQK